MRVLMMPDYRSDNPYQQLLADELRKLGAEVAFPVGYRRYFPLWRAWRSRTGFRVLHIHWLNPYLGGNSLLAQSVFAVRTLIDLTLIRLCRGSVVWTIHNRVSHESRWPRIERWLQRRVASSAEALIVHSSAALKELREDMSLPAGKVSVIPHGHYRCVYGPPIDARTARISLGLPELGRIYLCFGMLRPYKGIERLIGEWQSAQSPNSGDVLVIAGKALDDDFLSDLKALEKACDSVRIRDGFVPVSEVPIYFSAADLVVLPFSRILTSGSLLLAMSYSKPVIAPAFETIKEVLGDADDLLYDPDDALALRRSLERSHLLPLGLLQQKTEMACDRLGWPSIAQMTLDAYRTAAEGLN
jgi:glycosyltransferase involved in cell wall biosynthesis